MGSGRKLKGSIVLENKYPRLVFGLRGIQRLFGVSKTTASRYKNTFLKDAVTQQGNKLVIDTAEAFRLFGIKTGKNLTELIEN